MYLKIDLPPDSCQEDLIHECRGRDVRRIVMTAPRADDPNINDGPVLEVTISNFDLI